MHRESPFFKGFLPDLRQMLFKDGCHRTSANRVLDLAILVSAAGPGRSGYGKAWKIWTDQVPDAVRDHEYGNVG